MKQVAISVKARDGQDRAKTIIYRMRRDCNSDYGNKITSATLLFLIGIRSSPNCEYNLI